MFQHFNYSTFAPYLLISLQFLFLHLSTSLSFCPFPLKLSHRSVRLPSNFRQIRGRMAQSFTSVMPYPDGQRGFEFTVQCDFHRTATNAVRFVDARVYQCVCAKMGASMQPLDRTRRGMKERGGGRCFGNFYARVSSFISAAPTIEKLAVVAAV